MTIPSVSLEQASLSTIGEKPTARRNVSSLSIEVVSDSFGFDCLRDEWDRLVSRSPASPFQTFEWSHLWWSHLGGRRGRTLNIVLFRAEGELVGIAPLFRETTRAAGKLLYKSLKVLGRDLPDSPLESIYANYPLTDYFDFIVLPEWESAVARSFVQYLEDNEGSFDEVQLVNIQRTGFLVREFLQRLVVGSMRHHIRRAEVCPRIIVPRSIEEYLGGLDGSHRRRLKQAKRAVAGCIQNPVQPQELRQALVDLVTLHQKRWNKLGSPGLFFDKRMEMFLVNVMKAFFDRGWLWIRTVRRQDRVIAVRAGFMFKGVLYDYISGVADEGEDAKLRPGFALLVEEIEDALRRRASAVDLLRGAEQYKLQLANDLPSIWDIIVYNPRTFSSARCRTARLLRRASAFYDRFRRERLMVGILCGVHGVPRGVIRYLGERGGILAKHLYSLVKKRSRTVYPESA